MTGDPVRRPRRRVYVPTSLALLAVVIVASIALGGGASVALSSSDQAGSPRSAGFEVSLGPNTSNVTNVSLGAQPEAVAFDPGNGYTYALSYTLNEVVVLDGTSIVTTVLLPYTRSGITHGIYDAQDGLLYIEYAGGNGVLGGLIAMNGTTIAGYVTAGGDPGRPAYDSRNGYLYVPNNETSNVTVVSGLTSIATINVTGDPAMAVYDGGNGYVYVPSYTTNSRYLNLTPTVVSVINGTKLIATVKVGLVAEGATYDPKNGYVYVSNRDSGTVSILNGTQLIGTVTVGPDPNALTYNDANGYVYVVDFGSNSISVIKGTQVIATIPVGLAPSTPIYDPGDRELYVPNVRVPNGAHAGENVTIIDGTTQVGSIPLGASCFPEGDTYQDGLADGIVYDPFNGDISLVCFDSDSLVVIPTWFPVTFAETGLPNGTAWWVNITGGPSLGSLTPTASFHAPDGVQSYLAGSANPKYTAPSGSFVVNGTGITVQVPFSSWANYSVNLTESGLPSGTAWTASLNGTLHTSSSATITFSEPNGTYPFRIGSVPGYVASPTSGTVSVNGPGASASVAFSRAKHSVTFSENGLIAGTNWTVTLNGTNHSSTSSSVVFTEPDGTYGYSVAAVPGYAVNGSASGNVTVSGQAVGVNVSFANSSSGGLQALTFVADGLPAGTNWAVTLTAAASGLTIERSASLTRWSDGSTMVRFMVSPGLYDYSTTADGYTVSTGSSVVPNAKPQAVTIDFVPTPGHPPLGRTVFGVPEWGAAVGVALGGIGIVGLGLIAYRFRRNERESGKALARRLLDNDWELDEEPVIRTGR
jgi:YVTN family beta-propeller protein